MVANVLGAWRTTKADRADMLWSKGGQPPLLLNKMGN